MDIINKLINKVNRRKIYPYYSKRYKSIISYYFWIHSYKIPGYMSYGIVNGKKKYESVFLGMATWFITLTIYGIINFCIVGFLLTYFNFNIYINLTIFFFIFFMPFIIFPPIIISKYPKVKAYRNIIEIFCKEI